MDKLANLIRSVDMCCFLEFGETKLSKSNWSSCCRFSCCRPWVGSKAWGFVLFTHLYVCSKFFWDEKQTILRWWFERALALLNFKAPQRLQLYSIELQHSISYTFTFSLVARCQELMAEPCPNFLQRFTKCHFYFSSSH